MRISRPCYNKMYRCPGWAGGGLRYAKRDRCDGGRIIPLRGGNSTGIYEGHWWPLRINRCDTCDVIVLPSAVRWLDWRWLRCALHSSWRDLRWRWSDR